jgi:hypothetical protein
VVISGSEKYGGYECPNGIALFSGSLYRRKECKTDRA